MAPTIVIAAAQGFEARLLLRTEIFSALRESGARLVLLVPNPEEVYMREEFNSENVYLEQLRIEDYRAFGHTHRLKSLLPSIRRYTANWHRGPKEWRQTLQDYFTWAIKSLTRRKSGAVFKVLLWVAVWSARRFSFVRRALFHFENWVCQPRYHHEMFQKYKPDLLVVSSPGYVDWHAFLMREARHHGVKTASVVLAPDYPTCMGYPGAQPDHVVVWNETMRQELICMADLSPSTLHIGGVAQFDIYHRPQEIPSREELVVKYSLDPMRRIIFLGTRVPSIYPNRYLVGRLAEALAQEGLWSDCQLLVRLHPIYFRRQYLGDKGMEEDRQALLSLTERYPNLILATPEVVSERLSFDLDPSDANLLAACLKHSDVVINALSTLSLEAVAVDTPLINVLFDAPIDIRPSAYYPVTLAATWPHNIRILRSGACRIAHSNEELIESVKLYLKNPQLDREARARLRESECGPQPWDGHAGWRIGEQILSLVNGEKAVTTAPKIG